MSADYDYLIIGGGMTADTAAKGIREKDADGTIGILGEESTAPFPRPALSKKLWTDDEFTEDDAALDTADETGATLHLDSRVDTIDREAKRVTTSTGDAYGYGKLLIATGGHPRQISGLAPSDRVIYYRTLEHYHRLRAAVGDHPHVAVVGGGYIGTEIAAALVQNGSQVTLIHPDDVLGSRTFPAAIADEIDAMFVDAGVTVHGGAKVEGGTSSPQGVRLELSDGTTVLADLAVIGLGIEPSGTLARRAGLETSSDGGIVVDERLSTADPDVFAAGDVAEYPDAILGRRRVEHVDNANEMGAAAGRILAGSDEVYDHTPMFYSDLFDAWYEAVGTLDASLRTEVVDKQDGGKVVYYVDDDEVVGVLMWKVGDGVEPAKKVLAAHTVPDSFTDLI
ncbi:NAD(P)/FAD-dependent oxidoreductase [Aeromicrobium fastidiosum]|uniref:NAD(P)/FAD-dependent oxidoreductase n=1 Tax=Aeromicrobium fastidiosum TaxID=52699 RepID=A0A641AL53_9ACTN|nr:FAD-dependent oxidoreductase [Aeromicrobium fastidiosum]KAA1374634.1 NAD(P)/FAD-dependent oxidoreductase [Aeromicrobium fastidiosum]MBP2390820.1 NADPH-dependent 2,4-dienoyl-CoA reductase/sulfur reductase-like enzyme [Aeromicrobium fastidiosum]